MTTRYIVRDIDTKGCDFLLWGDGDRKAANVSLAQALADGLKVELVTMPSDKMDAHTKLLIDGEETDAAFVHADGSVEQGTVRRRPMGLDTVGPMAPYRRRWKGNGAR